MREFFGRRFSITLNAEKNLHPADCCDTLAVKEIQERKRKWQEDPDGKDRKWQDI